MSFATAVLLALCGYLAVGLLVAAWFLFTRLQHDPAAAQAGIGFRLLILPGCIALWPFLLRTRVEEPS